MPNFYPRSVCREKKLRTFAPVLINKTLLIDPWCNWQHNWFWFSRVQVRTLAGQPNTVPWCNWQHVCFWIRRVQVRDLTGQHFRKKTLDNHTISRVFLLGNIRPGAESFANYKTIQSANRHMILCQKANTWFVPWGYLSLTWII